MLVISFPPTTLPPAGPLEAHIGAVSRNKSARAHSAVSSLGSRASAYSCLLRSLISVASGDLLSLAAAAAALARFSLSRNLFSWSADRCLLRCSASKGGAIDAKSSRCDNADVASSYFIFGILERRVLGPGSALPISGWRNCHSGGGGIHSVPISLQGRVRRP